MSQNIVTLKSGSEVTQGHLKLYHSIDWLWFVFYSNFVHKNTVFEIFAFKKMQLP